MAAPLQDVHGERRCVGELEEEDLLGRDLLDAAEWLEQVDGQTEVGRSPAYLLWRELARALLASPRMLLSDEPTQGVDVGARSEIYGIMREVASAGVPVVVVLSDAKELEGLCDRLMVFSRGMSSAS